MGHPRRAARWQISDYPPGSPEIEVQLADVKAARRLCLWDSSSRTRKRADRRVPRICPRSEWSLDVVIALTSNVMIRRVG